MFEEESEEWNTSYLADDSEDALYTGASHPFHFGDDFPLAFERSNGHPDFCTRDSLINSSYAGQKL